MAGRDGRVVVVGGGLAGLAAAWELSRSGLQVTVLERAPRPGGRAAAERVDGFTFEALSPVVDGAPDELERWMAEVGGPELLLPLRPLLTSQVHRGRVTVHDPRGLLDLARVPGVRTHQALRLVRLPRLMARYGERLAPGRPEWSAELDDRSLADFGELYFGRSVLDYWMAPFATGDCLCDASSASRALFLRRQRSRWPARPRLPRAALAGLLEAAAERLPARCGFEARSVESGSPGRLAVFYLRDGNERALEADAVVVAVPAPEAAQLASVLLTAAERDQLGAVRYSPSLALGVATLRPLRPHPELLRVPPAEDSPLESALIEPGGPGGRAPDGRGLVTLRATARFAEAAARWPEEAIEKDLVDAFEQLVPGLRRVALFARVTRLPRALPRFEVGHYRRIARLSRLWNELRREGRRLYFAGDYLMDPSFEGAFASGRRAARELAADLD